MDSVQKWKWANKSCHAGWFPSQKLWTELWTGAWELWIVPAKSCELLFPPARKLWTGREHVGCMAVFPRVNHSRSELESQVLSQDHNGHHKGSAQPANYVRHVYCYQCPATCMLDYPVHVSGNPRTMLGNLICMSGNTFHMLGNSMYMSGNLKCMSENPSYMSGNSSYMSGNSSCIFCYLLHILGNTTEYS